LSDHLKRHSKLNGMDEKFA